MKPCPSRLLAAVLAAVLLAPVALPAAQPSGTKPAAAARAATGAKSGASAGMRAKPVHIEIDAPMPKNAPHGLGLDSDGGYAVTFLVRGTGITGIDKESLKVSSATAAGTDISKDDRGRDAWSLGPFPQVADDSTAATFEVRVKPGASRVKSAVPVLHGSIDVSFAAGREAKTATLATKPGSSAQLGPIKVAVPSDDGEDDEGGDEEAAAAALAAMLAQQAGEDGDGDDDDENAAMAAAFLGGMFGGGGDGFDLEVSGDTASLASLVLVVDGKEVKHRSWMNFGRGATYGFPAVKGDSVRVKAEFWTGRRTEAVSF